MRSSLTTWAELPPIDGRVLVIVNSPTQHQAEVDTLLNQLIALVDPANLSVIAASCWRQCLLDHGVMPDSLLLTLDADGRDLELNYFLEAVTTIQWVMRRQFRAIVGSAPHSMYNEELKEVFERRVGLLMGDGVFLAHALPQRYVYTFDWEGLLRRLWGSRKLDIYRADCRAIVDDCYREWVARGSRPTDDDSGFDGEWSIVERRLGQPLLAFDESSEQPMLPDDLPGPLASFLTDLRSGLYRYDATLITLASECAATVRGREVAIAERDERAEAVHVREAIIADLHARQIREVALRDAMLADLEAAWQKEVVSRDATIAELSAQQGREIAIRDVTMADQLAERDRRLAALQIEVNRRDQLLADLQAERVREVNLRDEMIAGLRRPKDQP